MLKRQPIWKMLALHHSWMFEFSESAECFYG